MSSIEQDGKVCRGFPFSLLKTKGGLCVDEFYLIKPHVYKVICDENSYILKVYFSRAVVQQQWEFFDKIEHHSIVPFVPFPNGKRYITGEQGDIYTLAPYMNGPSLSYTNERDRKESHNLLYQFQQAAQGIHLEKMIPKPPLYLKWEKRFHIFTKFGTLFEAFGQNELYHAITKKSYAILSEAMQLDWPKIEESAVQKGMWVHGDVASHNLIRNSGMVKLIDFDLLGQSPFLYDWIQLAQRWMYVVHTNELLSYKGIRQSAQDPLWLLGVHFPSDVMREWITFIKSNPSHNKIHNYLAKMEIDWIRRESFVEQLDYMLT